VLYSAPATELLFMNSKINTLFRAAIAGIGFSLFAATAWPAERMEFAVPGVKGRINVPNETVIPNSTHPFRPPVQYSFQYDWARGIAWGDVNGDGLNDIIAGSTYFSWKPELPLRIWGNTGNGVFVDRTTDFISGPVPVLGIVVNVFVHDFNNDGRADIYIVDSGLEDKDAFNPGMDGHSNHLLLSEADGKLHDRSSTLPGNVAAFNHFSNMADVNNDGNQDIVMTVLGGPKLGNGGVYFLLGDGKGGFTRTTQGIPLDFAFPWAITNAQDWHYPGTSNVCDLDGDGRGDLISGSYTSVDRLSKQRNVRFHQQQADSTFVEKRREPIPAALAAISDAPGTFTAIGAYQIVCGKLTGGKYTDVLVGWENRVATYHMLLRNNGNFDFTDVTLATFGTYESSYKHSSGRDYPIAEIKVMDVDGDGFDDLVYRPNSGGIGADALTEKSGFIHLNDGQGHFSPFRLAANGRQLTKVEALAALGCQSCDAVPLVFDAGGSSQNDLVLMDSRGDMTSPPIVQSKSIGLTTLINTAPGPVAVPGVIDRQANGFLNSYFRLYNAGTAQTDFRVTVRNTSGQTVGTTTLPIPPNAAKQYKMQAILDLVAPGTAAGGTYSVYLSSSESTAGYQHVVFNDITSLYENASACKNLLSQTSSLALIDVHTSVIEAFGFPMQVLVHNFADTAKNYVAKIYEGSTGTLRGQVSIPLQANASRSLSFVSEMQKASGVSWTPTSEGFANIVITDSTGGTPSATVTSSIDTSSKLGVGASTNMSIVCAVNPASASTASNGAVAAGVVDRQAGGFLNSYFRLYNAGTAQTDFSVTVRNTSGQAVGTTTLPIPPSAAKQYKMQAILDLVAPGTAAGGTYSVYLSSPASAAGYQHVIFNDITSLYENASACKNLLSQTSSLALIDVHTSVIEAFGFPMQVLVHNYASAPKTYVAKIYEGSTGTLRGQVSIPLQANASRSLSFVSEMQKASGVSWTPTSEGFANVVITDSTGNAPNATVTSSIDTSSKLGVGASTNMSIVCAINTPN